jgi:hypothetical protein
LGLGGQNATRVNHQFACGQETDGRAGVKTVQTLIRDRFVAALVAAALILGGLLAFYYPIHLGDYDPWGMQVPCGTALAPDVDQAVAADMFTASKSPGEAAFAPTHYAAQCNRAVWIRRGWSVPLTLAGVAIAVLAATGRWPQRHESTSTVQ